MPLVSAQTLNTALIAARTAVSARVFKAQYNAHQKYKYVSHEAVLQHAREALLQNGLVLEQRSVTYDGELPVKQSTVWRWSGVFALVHRLGEERAYTFSATTQPNDKAAYVASTSLDKVAHMRVLALAGTDDENAEADWHDNQPGGAAYAAPAQSAPRRLPPMPPSNVVEIRTKPQGLSQQLEWSVGLKTFALEIERVREPDALVRWWVDFKLKMAPQLDKGLLAECWQMFSQHVRHLDLDLRAIAGECDRQVKAARTKGGV